METGATAFVGWTNRLLYWTVCPLLLSCRPTASPNDSATWSRSTAFRSSSTEAGYSGFSVRMVPARRRSCGCSAPCCRSTMGSRRIGGFDVAREPQAVRRLIGLAGQSAAVDEKLTARENLELFGRLYKLPRSRRRAHRRPDRAVRSRLVRRPSCIDLLGRAASPPRHRRRPDRRSVRCRSSTSRRRGLDPRSRSEVWAAIRDLTSSGTAIPLTTQYLEEADQLANEYRGHRPRCRRGHGHTDRTQGPNRHRRARGQGRRHHPHRGHPARPRRSDGHHRSTSPRRSDHRGRRAVTPPPRHAAGRRRADRGLPAPTPHSRRRLPDPHRISCHATEDLEPAR